MKNVLRVSLMQTLVCLSFLFGLRSVSYAGVTTILFTEDFYEATYYSFPPSSGWYLSGWNAYNYWYPSPNGYGGSNGSAMLMLYYCANEDWLNSPSIDASGYATDDDKVYLDFDFWCELDYWNANYGPDYFVVYVDDGNGNLTQLKRFDTQKDYTYDNSGDYSYLYDPSTTTSDWEHYRFLIPKESRTANMRIVFYGYGYYACGGNAGIDNVVITGEKPINASFSPNFLDFGTQPVGTPSIPKCVTVTNESELTISISSATITGGYASSFDLVGTVPSEIAPYSSVDICVQFDPLNAGMLSADLIIANTSDNNPSIRVSLTGEALAPSIQLIPIGENFVDRMFRKTRTRLGEVVIQGVIAKNTGSVDLVISTSTSIGGDSPESYWLAALPEYPIPPGEMDTIFFAFSPREEGLRAAFTNIESNAANGVQMIDFVGTGILPRIVVMPQMLDFDSIAMGESVTDKLTIYNPGSDTLHLLEHFLSDADPDFMMTPLTPAEKIIPPEHSREVWISFRPVQRGMRIARFRVITNIPLTFEGEEDGEKDGAYGGSQSPQELIRRDTATTVLYIDIRGTGVPFGTLTSADLRSDVILTEESLIGVEKCKEIVITNPGDDPVTIQSATFTGASAAAYKLKGITLPYHLAAKSSVTTQVCGTPPQRGSNEVLLTIKGISNERPAALAGYVDIKGLLACAERIPEAAFTASVIVNSQSDTEYVTVANCGDVAASFIASVGGVDAALYTVLPAVVGPIASGDMDQVMVIFTPDTRGTKSGTLTFTDIAGNIAPMNVALGGEGGCAVPGSSQATYTIEEAIGKISPTEFKINITNTGNIAWDPGTPTVSPTDHFNFVAGPGMIPPGGNADITLSYHPKTVATHTAVVNFEGAGPCQENVLTINLTGQAVISSVSVDRTADGFILEQNVPNPTDGKTSFRYSVPVASNVRITLADITGRTVRELVNERVPIGSHEVEVNTSSLASGTYLYILDAGSVRLIKQLVVQR